MPASPKEVLILEHVSTEKAGTILPFLREHGVPYREIPLYEKETRLPSVDSARAVIVMGGPMNVNEEERHPFLEAEDAFLKEAIEKNVPILGICLGAQLLAKALGARVYKAERPEIGWDDVRLTEDASADRFLGVVRSESLKVLQWHEDTFDLPKESTLLGSSAAVPNQAFRHKGLFYGLQFHVEVDRLMLEGWFEKHVDRARILAEYDAYRPDLERITERLYGAFLRLCGEPCKS